MKGIVLYNRVNLNYTDTSVNIQLPSGSKLIRLSPDGVCFVKLGDSNVIVTADDGAIVLPDTNNPNFIVEDDVTHIAVIRDSTGQNGTLRIEQIG